MTPGLVHISCHLLKYEVMHSYEAWAGLLKFINESCLDQVTINHLIPRGHVELMASPAGLLRDPPPLPKTNAQFIITVCHNNYVSFSLHASNFAFFSINGRLGLV